MKFKVDENLPIELADLLISAGHDAVSVLDQKLGGADDDDIAPVCQREARAFVTFDLGFSDIRSYPPSKYPGLIVFRLKSQEKPHVLKVCERLLGILEKEDVVQRLWIVEESRVRIRRIESPES
jgi:predicted nuclease of predicted toxin-antitoxin system